MNKDKNIIVLTGLIVLLLIFSSCSDLTSKAVESINSDITGENYSRFYAQFPKTRTLGISWQKNVDNNGAVLPVIPAVIDPANVSVCDPCVIKVGTQYHMWFTRITLEDSGGYLIKRYSIRYAVSTDGINWNDVTNATNVPVISHGLQGVRVSSVIVTDNPTHTYRLWYLGKTDAINETGWQLYYAYTDSIANSGTISWKTERFYELYKAIGLSPEKFDATNISRASVLKDKQGTYKMWYGGHNGSTRRIGYATSQDGKNKWSKDYGIMSAGFAGKNYFDKVHVEYPCVLFDDGVYKMWYSGYNIPWEIGLAYSLDGVTFDYYDNQFGDDNSSVLKPEAFWEGKGIMNCSVIKDVENNTVVYKMWYTAEGNDGKFRIGYAVSY